MRKSIFVSTVLTLLLAVGVVGSAQAAEELGASGTRLAIGGGAPRFYMTYGHAEAPELFAPIIPELARLDILFKREGDGYAVYYKGQRQGEPWPIIRTKGFFSDFAIVSEVTISAPPPSDTTQQSRRCSGSEIIGELSTSSTVTTSLSIAWGLYCA